jgi:predicted N-formylglutamate amidohydrolase
LLIVGDHAAQAVPRELQGLGLPPGALDGHIGWDIGVAALGARLADALDAAFIAQRYSRLVIDCNRDPEHPASIPEVSDGVAVPGNRSLGEPARRARLAEVFEPYHARIAAEIEHRRGAGRPTLLFALHSFTPVLSGAARPWRFGVLHLGESRFSDAVLSGLRAAIDPSEVGDNQPYQMDGTDYTVPRHALANGLDYLELEVRQDLIADLEGQARTTRLFAPILQTALASL